MKTTLKALLISTALAIPFTASQADDDYTPMMGSYGMMGGGYGPGMGYGNGYHMQNGYGPGGMTGGYGGMGMMGGYGGMGMMGGYGGMGMMGGYGGMGMMGAIGLTDEQLNKMQKIRSEQMTKMSSMMNDMWKARNDLYKASQSNDQKALSKAYDEMSAVRKKAFLLHSEMRAKMQSVLTKEQKEKLQNAYRGMMMGY